LGDAARSYRLARRSRHAVRGVVLPVVFVVRAPVVPVCGAVAMASTPDSKMTEALTIINSYIRMLESGHVKEGLWMASKEETEFGIVLLHAVAEDIEAKDGK